MHSIRILLTGDFDYYFTGLHAELAELEGIQVLDAVPATRTPIQAVKQLQPDMVIVNLPLSCHQELQLVRSLHHQFPQLWVITLSVMEGLDDIALLLQAGAKGCLNKNSTPNVLQQAIAMVREGHYYICFNCAFCSLQWKLSKAALPLVAPTFTGKEQAIIRHLCEGDSNKQIAAHLHLSENMIERYRSRIRQKMGVKSVIGMVMYAVRNGLYDPKE